MIYVTRIQTYIRQCVSVPIIKEIREVRVEVYSVKKSPNLIKSEKVFDHVGFF